MRPFSKASSYGTVDGEKSTIGDVSSGSSRGVRGALPMMVSWLLMVAVSRLQMVMRRVILGGKVLRSEACRVDAMRPSGCRDGGVDASS
jgi:hypothetical protein